MALQKQTVALPLTKGIDKSRPNLLLDPDQLEDGVNTEILESGEITKRPGFASNVALAARTPLAMVKGNGAQGAIYGNNYLAMPYITSGGSTILQDTANIGQIKPAMGNLTAKLTDLLGYNLGSISSYDCYTNAITGEILLAFVASNTTGRVYKFDKNLNVIPFLTSPYCEFSGFNVSLNQVTAIKCLQDRVLFGSTTSSGINMVTFDTSGVAANSLIQSVTGIGTNWDACDGESGEFILAYESGGNIVVSRRSNSTGASLSSVTTSATNVTRICITQRIQTSANKDICLGILRSAGNKISLLRYNSSLTLQQTSDQSGGSSTYWAITVAATSNPSQELVATELGSSFRKETFARLVKFFRPITTTLTSFGRDIDRAGLFCKASQIVSGQPPVLMVSYRSEDTYNLQNSYALVQFGNPSDLVPSPAMLGMIGYGSAYPYPSFADSALSSACPMPNISLLDSTRAFIPLRLRSDSATLAADTASTYVLRACTIQSDANYRGSRSVKVGDRIFAASGGTYNISGAGLREIGFNVYPDPVTTVTDNGAGNVTGGVYQYCLVYEFIDDAGNLIESAPSQIFTTGSLPANRQWTIDHRIPGWVSYPQFRLAVYRTVAGGTILYRAVFGTYDLSVSTPTSAITIVDNVSDGTLVTGKLLYTTGGIVENIAPPYCQYLAFVKNRLWAYEYGSVDTLWFTKEVREGYFPQFSDLLKVQLPRSNGELMGVANLDDKIVVFKQNSVYVFIGDGPSETLVGDFSQAASITQGIGCINSRSIVETPQGIFFQSQEGIYVVDKSLAVQFIGQPLYKSEGTIIGSAYDPALNRVFFLSTTDLWVYYMTTGTWHRWTVTNPVDIDYLDGALYLMTTTRILKLTDGTWQDNGQNYAQTIKLGQFQFSGIQGYQRVYRLLAQGRLTDAASGSITVQTFFDGSSTATDTHSIAQSATLTGTKVSLEVRPSVQKCETMQVQLSHTANNSGLTISAVTAEVGAIGGAGRRAATGRAV